MLEIEIVNFLDIEMSTQKELFEYVSKKLIKKGYVEDDYLIGLMNREKAYPTGLKTEVVETAIPHTEMEFINKPFIVVVRLKNCVEFQHIGKAERVFAKLVFFLGISQANFQLKTIQKVLKIITDEEAVSTLLNCQDSKEIKEILLSV